ncbi:MULTISPECIES: hypothetical protein [Clostridium]|uniref:hypothetical protein n=1 Tax=Clostridium TaxID=1485 RepID=UPI0008264C26|nr:MULTISPECIES: hypothetical protein [Clostridium]PJI10126.1 hypothetical protein CUB90_20620 [Clostridium sp. CT7]
MNKIMLGIMITAVLIFTGCSSKSTNNTVATKKKVISNSVSSIKKNSSSTKDTTVKEKNSDIHPLSKQQKKAVDSKIDSAVKNIDSILKSIQDPSDIDLSSIN